MNEPDQMDVDAQRHRLQSDIFALESDQKRLSREKTEVLAEFSRIKKQQEQLLLTVAEREEELRKVEKESSFIEEELQRARQKLGRL